MSQSHLQTSPEFVQVDTALTLLSQVNLLRESNALALDIGGSLAKLIYLQPHTATHASPPPLKIHGLDASVAPALSVPVPVLNGTLHFFAFETANIHQLLRFMREHWAHASNTAHRQIRATGGGSYKYASHFCSEIDVTLTRLDEMSCAVAGLNFLLTSVHNEVYIYRPPDHPAPSPRRRTPLNGIPPDLASARHFVATNSDPFPYLLVNIGSGVSIVKVTGHDNFERVSGSSLGGGTFWGLSRILLDCASYDEVISLTKIGDNANVDMLVGDIYGGSYPSIGLDASVIAASFGKATLRPEFRSPNSSSAALDAATSSDFPGRTRAYGDTSAPDGQDEQVAKPSLLSTLKARVSNAIAGSTALWMHAASAVPPFGFIMRRLGYSPSDVLQDRILPAAAGASASAAGSDRSAGAAASSRDSAAPAPGKQAAAAASASDEPKARHSTRERFRPEDVALSLLRMVSYNIGQIAHLNARVHGLRRIYFGGNFVRDHPYTTADISFAVDFWSNGAMKALFLRHDGYLGAIGAFINASSAAPSKVVDERLELSRAAHPPPSTDGKASKKAQKRAARSKKGAAAGDGAVASDDPTDQTAPHAPAAAVSAAAAAGTTAAAQTSHSAVPNGHDESMAPVPATNTAPASSALAPVANGHAEDGDRDCVSSTENSPAVAQDAGDGSATASGQAKRRKRSKGKGGSGGANGANGSPSAGGGASAGNGAAANPPASSSKASKKASKKLTPLLAPRTDVSVDDVDDEGWTTVSRIRRRNVQTE